MDAPPRTVKRARELRKATSLPEGVLWRELRGKAVGDLRFRRQHPFGPYILDFYCPEARLAVEVDGWSHNMGDRGAKDERRDAWLAEQGVEVLQFTATEVLKNMDMVVATILARARP